MLSPLARLAGYIRGWEPFLGVLELMCGGLADSHWVISSNKTGDGERGYLKGPVDFH